MRRSVTPLVLVLAVCAAAGCKSTSTSSAGRTGEPGTPMLDGEPDVKTLPPERDDLTKVPTTLWSPAQRRMTASYYYLTAEYVAMKEHDGKKALSLFEAAYSLDPNPFLGGKMLQAKAASGDRAEAMLDAKKMSLLYPRDPQLRFFYGDMLAASGETDDATQQLEKCIELDPTYEGAYLELTEVYQALKQTPKAIVVAKELVKNVPSSVAGWSQLSRLYLTSNQPKNALTPARRAWEMQSNNPQLTQIYAITLQLNGKTKQAIRIYEQLYRLDPSDEELTGRMVELYKELGNLQSALELLDELAKQEGQTKPVAQMQKAILLWELKRNAEASALLDQLVKQYPDSDRVRFLAAYGHERMEQQDKALALYQSIAAESPVKREAELRVIVLLKTMKRLPEALALGQKLLAADGASWEAYGVVSEVYSDAAKFDDAVRTVDEGYKLHPDKPRLLFQKGVYQEKAGDRDGCIKTMRTVIQVEPENSSAFNYLGYLYAERGENLDEAEKLISHALELKPNDGFYLDSLGWVHYQKGQYDKAQPLLERATKLEPKEGVIYEHLGDLKKAKGDKPGARATYEQALKGTLEDKDRERIEKKLKDNGG